MADPRIINHQNFDLIRCRLCNKVFEEPKLLPCLHSFCLSCLQTYVSDNIMPSETQFSCPTCGDTSELPPVGGVSELMTNQILQRYIEQTYRDQTMKVAGREVMELQRQALTEAELQSPVIMTTIQQIADTASHVIANGMAEQDQVHRFDTVRDRVDLQTRAKRLQDQSIGIVHCIDHVNQEQKDREENKAKTRDTIKTRSRQIQETIRNIERDLLSQLDNRELDNNVKDEVHKVKAKLHRSLKANLTVADFIRLLQGHGTQDDIALYLPMVENQEERLLTNRIMMDSCSFSFDHPRVDLQSSIELMFGTLSEINEEHVMWDPTDFEIKESSFEEVVKPTVAMNHVLLESSFEEVNQSTVGMNDSFLQLTEPLPQMKTVGEQLSDVQGEIRSEPDLSEEIEDESLGLRTDNGESGNGDITVNVSGPNYQGHSNPRRRPMKSMSFDASMSSSWEPAMVTRTWSTNRAGYQTDHMNNNVNKLHHDGISVSNAIESLAPSIDLMVGQRSRLRRGSAPPSMIIDSLTRRRLSALTILEKANINTDGLLSTSDIETGLSQARLEWLRESVRRKSGERRASIDENSQTMSND